MRFTGNVTTPGQRWDWAQLDDGCRIAYSLTGSGPPLLVVPGWLSHLELDLAIPVQDRFLQALATGRTLIRYDRPGCGLSDPLRGSRTLAVELAAVRSVADAAGADGLDLFGYSLGAAVAACWAADNRGRTRRLVLYGGWVDGQAIGDEHSRKHVLGLVERHWGIGSELLTDLFAPDADAGTRRALAAYQRQLRPQEPPRTCSDSPTVSTSLEHFRRSPRRRWCSTAPTTARLPSPRAGHWQPSSVAHDSSNYPVARTCPHSATPSGSSTSSGRSWGCP